MYETKSVTLVAEELHTNIENGLTEEEAAARLRKYGENVLKETDRRTVWRMIFEQLNEPLMYILIAAAAISFSLGEIADACIILVVLVLNTTVGVAKLNAPWKPSKKCLRRWLMCAETVNYIVFRRRKLCRGIL